MPTAIVNGITRTVLKLKQRPSEIQFGFKSRNQLPLFMIWRLWFDENGESEMGVVLFNSVNWIGF